MSLPPEFSQDRIDSLYGEINKAIQSRNRKGFEKVFNDFKIAFIMGSSLPDEDLRKLVALALKKAGNSYNDKDKETCTFFVTQLLSLQSPRENAEILNSMRNDILGANVDPYGNQPVFADAVSSGVPAIVSVCLTNGADPTLDAATNHYTILMQAAHKGNEIILAQILEALRSKDRLQHVNEQSTTRRTTALLEAVSYPTANPACVKMLLDFGADITVKNAKGQSAWDLARDKPAILAVLRATGAPEPVEKKSSVFSWLGDPSKKIDIADDASTSSSKPTTRRKSPKDN